jgi:hypothetical protein
MRSKDIQAMPAAMLRCTPLTSIDGEGGSFKQETSGYRWIGAAALELNAARDDRLAPAVVGTKEVLRTIRRAFRVQDGRS